MIRRFADTILQRKVADLESENESLRRKLIVAETEVASLAAVVARDRARVEAETSIANRTRADAEGRINDSVEQSIRKFAS